MKKLLWFSRHEMTPEQKASLEDICGSIDICQIDRTINSAFELKAEIDLSDVIAIVAPIAIQQQFLSLAGSKPVIMAETERSFDENGKVSFRFVKWSRLTEIRVVKHDFSADDIC